MLQSNIEFQIVWVSGYWVFKAWFYWKSRPHVHRSNFLLDSLLVGLCSMHVWLFVGNFGIWQLSLQLTNQILTSILLATCAYITLQELVARRLNVL